LQFWTNARGEYWKTRNLDRLANNINASTRLIRGIKNSLESLCKRDGLTIESPINETATHITKFEIDMAKKIKEFIPPQSNN